MPRIITAPRYLADKEEQRCVTTAALTVEEKELLSSPNGVYHPICYIEALHEHPELFKEFLPEFGKYVERAKTEGVKTPYRTTISFHITDFAILHVLAEKYETSMSKIGRALLLYSIEKGDTFAARYRKEYGNER